MSSHDECITHRGNVSPDVILSLPNHPDIRVTQPHHIYPTDSLSTMEQVILLVLSITSSITWGLFYFIVGVCYLYFFLQYISGVNDSDDDDDSDGGTLIPVHVTNQD